MTSPALRAGFYPTAQPPPRTLFGVAPDLDPSSLAPAYAWIDREIAATTGKIERGLQPLSNEPLYEGFIAMKMMRNVSTISHALLTIL